MDRKAMKIAAAAAAMLTALMLAGCAPSEDISGDYEAVERADGFPEHLLLYADGTALIGGEDGSWTADTRGNCTLKTGGGKQSYTWSREGYMLTLRGGDEESRYVNSAVFASDDSAAALAGRWADELGQMLMTFDADGTGLLTECGSGTQTTLRWQARDGILRLEYDDPEGLTFEYLTYETAEGLMRFCAYGGELDTDYTVVMSAPETGTAPEWIGEYRYMAVSSGEEDMPRQLVFREDGTVSLDDAQGEWIRYGNGITVMTMNDVAVPMILGLEEDTLLMLETLSDTSVLWAREDTFAPDGQAAALLTGRWQDADGDALTLRDDGTADLTRQGETVTGTAEVGVRLIRLETGDTVEYIRYAREEGGVRLAWGTGLFDEPEDWPLFTAPEAP